MRKFNRATATVPACFVLCAHSQDKREDIPGTHKQGVCVTLERMQERRSVSYEGPLASLGQYMKLFRQKRHHVHLRFTWSNLYWSHDHAGWCGYYKDKPGNKLSAHSPNEFIDSCIDDSPLFLLFRSDGTVDVRPNLLVATAHRAREISREFSLHMEFGRLRNMRKQKASAYLTTVDELATWRAGNWRAYPQQELQAIAPELVSTIVRRIFPDVL